MYFDTFEQSKRHQADLRIESERERLARKASRRAAGRRVGTAGERQSRETSGVASGLAGAIASLRALAAREAASSHR